MSNDDFVGIVHSLTNFVQNERNASFNEAVDMMLDHVRTFMNMEGIKIREGSKYLPELFDDIKYHYTKKSDTFM